MAERYRLIKFDPGSPLKVWGLDPRYLTCPLIPVPAISAIHYRVLERDKGKALAAHSTLNRLELSAQSIDLRYHKIQVQPDEVEQLLIQRAVKAIPRKSAEIVLDFDATDDPLHGSQEGGYFNGYYRHYCRSEEVYARSAKGAILSRSQQISGPLRLAASTAG